MHGCGTDAPFQQASHFFVANSRGFNGFQPRDVEHDLAIRVDEEARGRAMDSIGFAGPPEIAARVLQGNEAVVAHDSDGAFLLAADQIDRDDVEILRLVLVENLLEARKLRAAPLSTREPEVDEDDLATVVGEPDFLVGHVLL